MSRKPGQNAEALLESKDCSRRPVASEIRKAYQAIDSSRRMRRYVSRLMTTCARPAA